MIYQIPVCSVFSSAYYIWVVKQQLLSYAGSHDIHPDSNSHIHFTAALMDFWQLRGSATACKHNTNNITLKS